MSPRRWVRRGCAFEGGGLYFTGIIGNLVMFVVGYLAGTLLPGNATKPITHLTMWDAGRSDITAE